MTPCLKCTNCLLEKFTECLNRPEPSYREWSRSKWGANKPLVLDPQRASLLAGAVGLVGEAAEVLGRMKKVVFHEHPLDGEMMNKLALELGDTRFYFEQLSIDLGMTIEHIERLNRQKLDKRYPEGFSPQRSLNRTEE